MRPLSNNLSQVTIISLVLFASILAYQHSFIFPYHDDYGLAVLDYVGTQRGFVKTDYHAEQLFAFLEGMYVNWSGRIVSLFILIYTYSFGLNAVRTYQALSILFFVMLSARLIQRRDGTGFNVGIAVLAIVYLSLPGYSMKSGVYWFAAASGYLWAFPFIAAAAVVIDRRGRFTCASVALLAFAAAFHEQIGIAIAVFSFLYLLSAFTKSRRLFVQQVALAMPIFLTIALTVLAPGNFARAASAAVSDPPHTQRLFENLEDVLLVISSQQTAVYLASLGIAVAALVSNRCENVTLWQRRAINIICVVMLLLGIWLYPLMTTGVTIAAFTILLWSYVLRRARNAKIVLMLFLAGLSSMLVVCLAPIAVDRAVLPFFLFSAPALAYVLTRELSGWARIGFLLLGAGFGLWNAAATLDGHRANYEISQINDATLRTAAYRFARGDPVPLPIELYKYPDRTAMRTPPYERPIIEKWMRTYYGLPPDSPFSWQ